jgi:hypothetical protein
MVQVRVLLKNWTSISEIYHFQQATSSGNWLAFFSAHGFISRLNDFAAV